MRLAFADTAGWVAAADAADPKSAATRAARDRWLEGGGILVTTNYVCDETLTLLRNELGLKAAEDWWGQTESSPRVRMERIDAEREERARALFFRYRDKDFSFTDCTSFVVMRALRIRTALTTDRHFRQMGYAMLP
ncbi:MAG: type II toxin-antitoxin system VapC family toxin [Kiritimatiellae bacterium]|nr:type II toxin-antitoxin system VapC family toxin [Kiritimatiellia bacterium]